MFMPVHTPSRRPGRRRSFAREELALDVARVPAGLAAVAVDLTVREDVLTVGGSDGVALLGTAEHVIDAADARHVFTLAADVRDGHDVPVALDDLRDARARAVQGYRVTSLATGIDDAGLLHDERVRYDNQPAVLGILVVDRFTEVHAAAARVPLWQRIASTGALEAGELIDQWARFKGEEEGNPTPNAVWLFRSLHVRPEVRGQRLGAALMAHALTTLPASSNDAVLLVPCPLPCLFEAERHGSAPVTTREPHAFAAAVRGLRAYYGRLGFRAARRFGIPGVMYLDLQLRHPLLAD